LRRAGWYQREKRIAKFKTGRRRACAYGLRQISRYSRRRSPAEGAFVARIYAVNHFQQNIEQQKLLKGGRNADPFVIAKAAVEDRAVVTMEILKPNAAKIPNICQHFNVRCFSLEEFMAAEGWVF
jgi:hypothetical protein